jgi:hypothetical protein
VIVIDPPVEQRSATRLRRLGRELPLEAVERLIARAKRSLLPVKETSRDILPPNSFQLTITRASFSAISRLPSIVFASLSSSGGCSQLNSVSVSRLGQKRVLKFAS